MLLIAINAATPSGPQLLPLGPCERGRGSGRSWSSALVSRGEACSLGQLLFFNNAPGLNAPATSHVRAQP